MIDFAGHAKSSASRVRLTLVLMCLAGCTFIFGQDVNQAPSAAKPKSAGAGQVQRIYRQGMAALERRDLAAARAAFEKVVRLAPKSPEGHNSLGWVLLAQGEAQPAISQFRTALQFKPDFEQAHINLANALVATKDIDGAMAEGREAVRLAPKDSEAHRVLGRALSFQGGLKNAPSELHRA